MEPGKQTPPDQFNPSTPFAVACANGFFYVFFGSASNVRLRLFKIVHNDFVGCQGLEQGTRDF